MEIHLSNFVKNIKDYKLRSNDERTLFDWLVLKQYDFGLGKPFFHSVKQVQEETLVTKYLQKQIFTKFVNMGFLTLGEERHMNNPYRTFLVTFSVLAKPEVLGSIIEPGTDTYNNLISYFVHWQKEERMNQKPLTKKRKKELEAEKSAVDALHSTLVKCWNTRVDMYNDGILTGEKPTWTKVHAQTFDPTTDERRQLGKLRNNYNDKAIENSFTVFADKVLKGEIKPDRIMSYFLTNHDGDFSVVRDCNNYFITQYGMGR